MKKLKIFLIRAFSIEALTHDTEFAVKFSEFFINTPKVGSNQKEQVEHSFSNQLPNYLINRI